jgi:hypothetical protein
MFHTTSTEGQIQMATLSHKKLVARAAVRREKLVQAIYACAPNHETPFSECKKLAPTQIQEAFRNADLDLLAAEQAAVSAGKAWRASFGMLTWNR